MRESVSTPYTQRGSVSVSDRLSGQIHAIIERNSTHFDNRIKLAATANDGGV